MDERWTAWVKENLERGCAPQELAVILLQNHFALPDIHQMMGARFPGSPGLAHPALDHKALAELPLLRLGKEPRTSYVANPHMQLFTLEEFLTPVECDALVNVINHQLRPSTVTVPENGFRTSSTSDLTYTADPLVSTIDQRIGATLGIRLAYSEPIQAQKYALGQEFKSHTDYFKPHTEEYQTYANHAGNRTWTFMVYLNDTPRGGGTQFAALARTFYPKKGMAVLWNNLRPDGSPNPQTLHCGLPVEAGEKYIITKWFRERGWGPMFGTGEW
jgi:prolyl 4-hydroxylase